LLENAGSGTAAAPGIAFDGDSNTGIYRPGADQLAFATNGAQALYINSSGNVGIGTSSPGSRLEVSRLGAAWTGAAASSAAAVFIHNGNNLTTGSAALQISGGSTSSSAVYFGDESDADAGSIQYGHGSDSMLFRVNAAERMRIDASGNVGIGTSSPDAKLKVQPVNSDIPQSAFSIRQNNGADTAQATFSVEASPTDGVSRLIGSATSTPQLAFYTGGTERMRIDSSGRLLVGTSTYSGTGTGFEIEGTGNFGPQIRATAKGSDEYPVYQILRKSRGASIVQNGDFIFEIQAQGYDGSSYLPAATIRAEVDGTPGANDMPGRLVFFTTADGASFPTEHFRIASNGDLTATDTTIGSNSDSRLKTNIADFAYDLEVFKQYQPKTFDWKNPNLHGNKTSQRGFIAQDVEAIDDYWVGQQAVGEDSADAEFLDADRLAKTLKLGKKDAMYVSVIQQLLAKVETLETKVAALEAS